MTNTAKHTPAPVNLPFSWCDNDGNNGDEITITDKENNVVAQIFTPDLEESKEIAAFIVKAVNNHERLVEALKEITEWWEKDGGDIDAAINKSKAALAAVEAQ